MMLLLYLSVHFNSAADNLLKLYPLIVFSILAIIFTMVYLFRVVEISYGEIKYIGLFSSRDSAIITEGKTIVIDMLEKNKISIKLYGNEGFNPDIKWLQNEDGTVSDICLFRGKTYGKIAPVIRILNYFGVKSEDYDAIFTTDDFKKQYKNVTVSSLTVLEHKQIRIQMDKTV